MVKAKSIPETRRMRIPSLPAGRRLRGGDNNIAAIIPERGVCPPLQQPPVVGSHQELDEVPPKAREGRKKPVERQNRKKSWMDNDLLYYSSLILIGIIGSTILRHCFGPADWLFPGKNKTVKRTPIPSAILNSADGEIQWQNHLASQLGQMKVLTDEHIKYKDGKRLFLVVAGFVFDVTDGGKTYEKGSGYHGFIGRDGTRAFVTGQFDDAGLVPDIDGLDTDGILGISKWINFYLNSEKYKFVGVHQGTFFDEKGMPTKKMEDFQELVMQALEAKFAEDEMDKKFPSCNMEWSVSQGSRLWCSEKSGGVDRGWIGLPRIFKEDGKERCACISEDLLNHPNVEMYKGCPPDSVECFLRDEDE